MGVSADEDVAIELSLDGGKGLQITPWDNLMSVDDSNLEVANGDYLGLRQVGLLIEVALHYVGLALGRC